MRQDAGAPNSANGTQAPACAAGDTLTALRRATREHHAELERRLPPSAIAASPAAYQRILAAFFGFYEPLEERIRRAEPPLDASARQKTPALRADLAALGKTPAELDALSRCDDGPDPGSPAEALGCAYVVEGATLGGQIIARHVRARLGLGPNTGALFFSGYGRQTGTRWREFVAIIERHVAHPDRARAGRAARDTFVSLTRWLETRSVLDE